MVPHVKAHHFHTNSYGNPKKTTPQEANKPKTEARNPLLYLSNIFWKKCAARKFEEDVFQFDVSAYFSDGLVNQPPKQATLLRDVAGWHKKWVDRTYGKPIIEAWTKIIFCMHYNTRFYHIWNYLTILLSSCYIILRNMYKYIHVMYAIYSSLSNEHVQNSFNKILMAKRSWKIHGSWDGFDGRTPAMTMWDLPKPCRSWDPLPSSTGEFTGFFEKTMNSFRVI